MSNLPLKSSHARKKSPPASLQAVTSCVTKHVCAGSVVTPGVTCVRACVAEIECLAMPGHSKFVNGTSCQPHRITSRCLVTDHVALCVRIDWLQIVTVRIAWLQIKSHCACCLVTDRVTLCVLTLHCLVTDQVTLCVVRLH